MKAIGLRIKSGFAIAAIVSKDAGGCAIEAVRTVALSSDDLPQSRCPSHPTIELPEKQGAALSAKAGTLDISSETDGEDIVLRWVERGGPAIGSPSGLGGFGSKLVQRSVTGNLGGTIVYDWDKGGLIVTLRMRRERLTL